MSDSSHLSRICAVLDLHIDNPNDISRLSPNSKHQNRRFIHGSSYGIADPYQGQPSLRHFRSGLENQLPKCVERHGCSRHGDASVHEERTGEAQEMIRLDKIELNLILVALNRQNSQKIRHWQPPLDKSAKRSSCVLFHVTTAMALVSSFS